MKPSGVRASGPALAAVFFMACGGPAAPTTPAPASGAPVSSAPALLVAASSGASPSAPPPSPTPSTAAIPAPTETSAAPPPPPPPNALRPTDVFYIVGWSVTLTSAAESPGVELCTTAQSCKKWLKYPEAQQVSQDFGRESWVVVKMGQGEQANVTVEADQAKVQVQRACSGTERPPSPGLRIALYRVAKSVKQVGYGGLQTAPPCRLP